jgi:hypothetical protein
MKVMEKRSLSKARHGQVVSGTVELRVPFGFWANVGLPKQAFADLRYIPEDAKGMRHVPLLGEKITGVIIGFAKEEPRLSMLPEHLKNPTDAPVLTQKYSKPK